MKQIKKLRWFLIGIFFGYIGGLLIFNWFCNSGSKGFIAIIKESSKKNEVPKRDKSIKKEIKVLYAAVLTAKQFLNTRATACNKTWASKDVNIEFFSQSGSHEVNKLPIINLPGVLDSDYPPQKKSFRMLEFICQNYIEDYQWFLRADDDAFFRMEKLLPFLNSLNFKEKLYIGQPGVGRIEKRGKLNLNNMAYCMGGPGVILSQSLLREVCPYLEDCLNNVGSTHEDVEIGRCITRITGIQCTQAQEMRALFYFNYFERSGSFKANLDEHRQHILPAISIHPIKNDSYMYRMYNHLNSIKTHLIRHKMKKVKNEIKEMVNNSKSKSKQSYTGDWHSIDFRTISTYRHKIPKRKATETWNKTTTDIVHDVFTILNANASRRFYEAELLKLRPSYYRYMNNVNGLEYRLLVLFKITNNNKYIKSRQVALNVKKSFQNIEIRVLKIKKDTWFKKLMFNNNHDKTTNDETTCYKLQKPMHIILPLAGRFSIFQRFLDHFEKNVLSCQEEEITLTVIYPELDFDQDSVTNEVVDLIENTQSRQSKHIIRVVQIDSQFNRGKYLQMGADSLQDDNYMCFMDVDLIFSFQTIYRFALNGDYGQPYFPIFLAQYDPNSVAINDINNNNYNYLYNDNKDKDNNDVIVLENNDRAVGYWRESSFGMACMYKKDFKKVGGFDLEIAGWGKEDIDLYDRFIKFGFNTMRSIEPDLVHIFHAITCHNIANDEQRQMCENVKAETYSSRKYLAQRFYTEFSQVLFNRAVPVNLINTTIAWRKNRH